MNRIAFAGKRRDAKRRGALAHLNIGYLAEVEHAEIDGFRMTGDKVLHNRLCDRLQMAEMNSYPGKLEELGGQEIMRRNLRLFHVAQFLKRIQNAMDGRSRKRQILGEL